MNSIKSLWKQLASESSFTATDIAALCLFRSMVAESPVDSAVCQLLQAFSPVTNPVKLSNGRLPYQSLVDALGSYRLSKSPLVSQQSTEDQQTFLKFAAEVNARINARINARTGARHE